jgi:hypothetical protein
MKNVFASIHRASFVLVLSTFIFGALLVACAFWSGQMVSNFFDDHRWTFVLGMGGIFGVLLKWASLKSLSQIRVNAIHLALRYHVLTIAFVSLLFIGGSLYGDAIARSVHTATGPVVLRGEQTFTTPFLSDGGQLILCALFLGLTFFSFGLVAMAAGSGVYAALPYSLQQRIAHEFPNYRKWFRL